jgi:hypothetical protein
MKATELVKEHPEYIARKAMWRKYKDLYAGGEQMRSNAAAYLLRRQKEPGDVYGERLNRVFYENYIGSIVDWYAATLFRREPLLSFEGDNEPGRRFFQELSEDCDLKGSALSDFFRRQFVEALVNGSSWVLVDFPRHDMIAGNRAEEDAMGASRAYLVGYGPEDITNWSLDERGNLEWAVVRVSGPPGLWSFLAPGKSESRWMYYDRERYLALCDRGQGVEVSGEGFHALTKQGKVPLVELKLSEGLWLMNKAALLQLEHFNKSNALSWALTMGLFAMPVVYTDREFDQMVGESYYLKMGQGDRFGWTEPEGKVFQIAEVNLERLKDEIYRVCYLLTQAGGPTTSGAAQSALSKQRDYAVTQEILRAYGDAMKDAMKRILRAVNSARGDDLTIDVAGLDEFDIGEFSSELADAEKLMSFGIGSPTLKKQILKRLASKYLCDVRQEVKDQISQEIDEWLDSTGGQTEAGTRS